MFLRPKEINKEEHEGSSMRCGRKLAKDGDVSITDSGIEKNISIPRF